MNENVNIVFDVCVVHFFSLPLTVLIIQSPTSLQVVHVTFCERTCNIRNKLLSLLAQSGNLSQKMQCSDFPFHCYNLGNHVKSVEDV